MPIVENENQTDAYYVCDFCEQKIEDPEENSQKQAVWIAAISLAFLVFFEALSLLIRIYFKI